MKLARLNRALPIVRFCPIAFLINTYDPTHRHPFPGTHFPMQLEFLVEVKSRGTAVGFRVDRSWKYLFRRFERSEIDEVLVPHPPTGSLI